MSTRKRYKKRKTKKNKSIKYIKESCSPKKKGDQLSFTCYTSEALFKLKKVWNVRHPDQIIKSNKPREIWEKLREFTKNTCSTESCWLRHQCIKNDLDKSMWDNNFAPYSPKNWSKNPQEWLTSTDIQKVMAQWEKAYPNFIFIGPSPINYDEHLAFNECVWEELCKFSLMNYRKQGVTKIGVIFNLDKHYQPGSHWVALFIDGEKKKIYYFDSYGDDIPSHIDKFSKEVSRQSEIMGEKYEIIISKNRHQYGNSECGMYSLFFLVQLLQGTSHATFEKYRIPDKKMIELRKKFFNSQ
jgi:hypothetical protein